MQMWQRGMGMSSRQRLAVHFERCTECRRQWHRNQVCRSRPMRGLRSSFPCADQNRSNTAWKRWMHFGLLDYAKQCSRPRWHDGVCSAGGKVGNFLGAWPDTNSHTGARMSHGNRMDAFIGL